MIISSRVSSDQNSSPEDDLTIFRKCSAISDDIHAQLTHQLRSDKNALNALYRELKNLTPAEYSMLIGMLVNAKNPMMRIFLSKEFCDLREDDTMSNDIRYVANTLIFLMHQAGIRTETEQQEELRIQKKFVTDMLLYLRATSPLGINILNPDGNPEKVNYIDMTKKSRIIFSNGKVIMRIPPFENGICKAKIEESAAPLRGFAGASTEIEIPENKPFYIGRPLIINELLGTKFNENISFPIDMECTHRSISRGASMVIRKGSRLYIYDRGSSNSIRVDQNDLAIEYQPVSQVLPDGSLSYGMSQMIGPGARGIFEDAVDDSLADD